MTLFWKRITDKLKTYQFYHLNVRLIILIIVISILGINVVSSATPEPGNETKQILGFIVGMVFMCILTLIDYKFILKYAWLIYLLNLLLLVAVQIFGEAHKGAKRWIEIAGIQFQPSEISKIFLILFFAYFFHKHRENLNTFRILALSAILFAVPLLLIVTQPALSISIVICLIFLVLIYTAGLSHKLIFGTIGTLIPVALIFVYLIMQPDQKILKDYQMKRIQTFLDGENDLNYQQDNAVIAIGSGGLWGKGLHNDSEDSVKNGNFIPEPHTDFIFAIVGEELGFVGTSSVILFLAAIAFECIYVGCHAPDLAGKIICFGVSSIVAIQTFLNIGVVTKMLPNTGVTLPFVSYGLTSLISIFIGMGFVLNVGLQRKKAL